jgi:hypothetical protein
VMQLSNHRWCTHTSQIVVEAFETYGSFGNLFRVDE